MPAVYVQPTLAEFQAVLEGFLPLSIPGTRELVFGKRVDKNGQHLSLRVYTSLEPDGLGRECGTDAIRVEIYFRNAQGSVKRVGGSKRVNRTKGWQKRLGERIAAWEESLGPICPKCGCPTVERDGKYGSFHGCSQYPECKGIVKLDDRGRPSLQDVAEKAIAKRVPQNELDFHLGSP